MGNVEVRKNKEGYELNLNTLIYSELLMSNVRFLVTNKICRVLPWKVSVLKKTLNALNYYLKAPNIVIVHRFLIKTQLKQERIQNG